MSCDWRKWQFFHYDCQATLLGASSTGRHLADSSGLRARLPPSAISFPSRSIRLFRLDCLPFFLFPCQVPFFRPSVCGLQLNYFGQFFPALCGWVLYILSAILKVRRKAFKTHLIILRLSKSTSSFTTLWPD